MSTHAEDAGLRAVARVRGVRESDSRIGLRTAMHEHQINQTRVEDLRSRLATAGDFATGSAAAFLSQRASLAALGSVLVAAEASREESRTISEAALARWQQDRARLDAIDLLLERRAVARRAEQERTEARELDDIAAQRWLRQQHEDQQSGGAR